MATQTTPWRKALTETSAAEYEDLYREQMPRIYNFFRYRFGNNALAEDLTATTFEKAWRKRHQYRHDLSAFTTWLFTIAQRVAIDHYRRPKSREVPLDHALDLAAPGNPEEEIQKQNDIQHLNALLAQISDRERALVALKYGAGLTNRAIAELSGLSESNVAVILHRTLKTLRKAWEGSHG
jgi:RNA polymerase sigma-70 factor (ECF subfamily)